MVVWKPVKGLTTEISAGRPRQRRRSPSPHASGAYSFVAVPAVRPVLPGGRQPRRAAGEDELPRVHLPVVEAQEKAAVSTARRVAPDLGGVVGDGATPVPRDRGAADDGDRVQAEEDVE
jgi:hypothetical protein